MIYEPIFPLLKIPLLSLIIFKISSLLLDSIFKASTVFNTFIKYNLTELSRKAKELYAETEREYMRRGLLASIAESINDISELAKKQAEAIFAATMNTDDY